MVALSFTPLPAATVVTTPEPANIVRTLFSQFSPEEQAVLTQYQAQFTGTTTHPGTGKVILTMEDLLNYGRWHMAEEAKALEFEWQRSDPVGWEKAQRAKAREASNVVKSQNRARYDQYLADCKARKAAAHDAKLAWHDACAKRDAAVALLNAEVAQAKAAYELAKAIPAPVPPHEA